MPMKKSKPGKSKVLDSLLERCGMSRADLAERLGVHYQAVAQWATAQTRITAERASEIEKKTNGAIRRRDLRPDLFT